VKEKRGGNNSKTPKKLRGCIAASPIVPFETVSETTYLFFFLAFFLAAIYILLSISVSFLASESGGARIQYSSIEFALKLVKRKVMSSRKKSRMKN
jgi:hypothetical protein